jgi:elongation factor Ts
MKITVDQIKKLREETGAPVIRVKKVLEETLGNLPVNATHQTLQAGEKKASEILRKEGFEKAAKRAERETRTGILCSYSHHTQKVVGIAEIFCETDFVARNELFQKLGKDLAMQVASMGEKKFESQEFIKDPSKKVADLIKDVIAKTGENVKLGRVIKIELGQLHENH